jgi:hypothetical protein
MAVIWSRGDHHNEGHPFAPLEPFDLGNGAKLADIADV